MIEPQELHPTGHRRLPKGENAMPAEDAHANKTFFGRSGKLKAHSSALPRDFNQPGRMAHVRSLQKARKRK